MSEACIMNQLNAVAVVYACKISGASLAVPWKSRSPFSFCCLLVLTAFHCIRIVVPAAKAPAPFRLLSCGPHGWYGNRRKAARRLQGRFAQVSGSSLLKVRLPCIGAPFWPFLCATMSVRFHRYNFRECALHENKKCRVK